ncbi:MAG: malto-oligosyltrehalose trehalohydrolase [Acidobacteria bacterium]|nr:malto-oligosyltrehalose trehalohydrolase [Acidobacteriota bacterium]
MTSAPGAAIVSPGRCRFRLWAPEAQKVEVQLVAPEKRAVRLERTDAGFFQAVAEGVEPGARYFYRLNGKDKRPDPASRHQPEGVHGPSEVPDTQFTWEDGDWKGLPLPDYVLYEIHVGAFTPEGTFDAAIPRLDLLKDLGVTALEIMPVAQCPGSRNWGYDGVYPYAVQHSYGGPDGLKRLVNACHRCGLAVVLDVVYNHLGPEGNYLADFGPYFTDRYKTPWGLALNFDGPFSDPVREYFIENALTWLREFHMDALRLDAIHGIVEFGARPFLAQLSRAVRKEAVRLNRPFFYLIAESDLNDRRTVTPLEEGGAGLDAQWSDDFHHSLHALLTGEQGGYYQDFGRLEDLATATSEGFVYSGRYSAYRRRSHGTSSKQIPAHQLVVCCQNHDQVGNRMEGERLSRLVSLEAQKLAAGVLLLSPFVPLLFMGEEYGEPAPFLYFVHHSDPGLIEAVRKGRKQEYAAFRWKGEPPDPQDEETFLRSKLQWELRAEGTHKMLWDFHRELLRLRKKSPALRVRSKEGMEVKAYEEERMLSVLRRNGNEEAWMVFRFASPQTGKRNEEKTLAPLSPPPGKWKKQFDSADARWGGRGSTAPDVLDVAQELQLSIRPESFVLFSSITDSGT